MSNLEVFIGPMFSKKTRRLIERADQKEKAGKTTVLVKPTEDDRYSEEEVTTHPGEKVDPISQEAVTLERGNETIQALFKKIRNRDDVPSFEQTDVIGFDEANLFSEKLHGLCHTLLDRGKSVLVAGLNLDFRGKIFSHVAQLYMEADDKTELKAICEKCGQPATRTQRLTPDGEIAPATEERIKVGKDNIYEARCKKCFKKPQGSILETKSGEQQG